MAETATVEKKSKKISLFTEGQEIQVPEYGTATVLEVHGRGWVKVEGVPKAWHKMEDVISLNPEAKAAYDKAIAEREQAKADKLAGKTGKRAKLEARLEKAQARYEALGTTIEELKTQLEALDGASMDAGSDDDGESEETEEGGSDE